MPSDNSKDNQPESKIAESEDKPPDDQMTVQEAINEKENLSVEITKEKKKKEKKKQEKAKKAAVDQQQNSLWG